MAQLSQIVPILRIFDENKAKTFYLDFLGFSLDWEHRFEPEMPLYMQISRDSVQIHLSEHHGDCSPGAAIRVHMNGVRELQKELIGKKYAYARPGLEKTSWNAEECTVTDPFGNRLVFCEYLS
ncbi:glyoxalase superfamily protein [Cohnella sp. GCM10020058]|uniref:glyoxalase superfamily protein n=1 Tax=Cohnella sp. GCM10020058 TaxID=3317330 RepID=UPI003642540D